MRCLLIIPFLLIASPAFAQENEAEKLFRAMEKKIVQADSIKVVFRIDGHYEDATVSAPVKISAKGNGSFFFMTGNKVRFESETERSGQKKLSTFAVSDGNQFLCRTSVQAKQALEPSPAKLRENLAHFLTRSGCGSVGLAVEIENIGKEMSTMNLDKELAISTFGLGKVEKSTDAHTQIIEYSLTFEGRDVVLVQLWIDSKTLLPQKRHVAANKGRANIIETYTEFILNPQLDPKLFELPK